MAALQLAHGAAHRPLRAFHVKIRSAAGRQVYTALARSSGDALDQAINRPDLAMPVTASVKPVGTPAEAMALFRRKMALSDLVEG